MPMDFLFSLYAFHTQALEDAINEMARSDNCDSEQMERILHAYGLNINHLTTYELEYIESEVAKRR